jgi:hypothetical protein
LLDALTRMDGLSADALAMAAWVSPSSANRSRWFSEALQRAQANRDERTAGFVQRRIVASRMDSNLVDWAWATFHGAGIDRASDGEAQLLRAQLGQASQVNALRAQAYRELLAWAQRQGDKVPSEALWELASLGEGLDAGQTLKTLETLASRGWRSAAWAEKRTSMDGARGVEAARRVFQGELLDLDDGIAIAQALSHAGQHGTARELYALMSGWSPNRSEIWAGLAAELGATNKDSRQPLPPAMDAALRRARELSPGESRYREELALRSSASSDQEKRNEDRYLVNPDVFLKRRKGLPQAGPPDVSERQLHWLRAVVMHPDKRVSQLIHYAREIVIAPRSQDELEEPIPMEGDLFEILRARVHRKDGGTAFAAEEHNEGNRPRIRWPDLEPGDTVEVALRTWTSRPVGGRGDAPFYFLDYAGSSATKPLLYNEVVLEQLPGQNLFVDVLHGSADRREERKDGDRTITRFIWDNPITIAEEPLAPPSSEIVPVIAGSTFAHWDDFRKWYAEAVRGFSEPDEQIKRLAQELTAAKKTRDEKINALFTFVADDIRYVNYISGEWWLPNRPQQLLARREGDCDDKAILLIALLKAIGIEAKEVLVQTRMTGEPSLLRASKVAIPKFDHGIAFLPGPNGGTYLDATSPQSRLGPLSSMDARAAALRMDEGPAEIVELPASNPNEHGTRVRWTVQLKADGAASLSGEEHHFGDSAFWARSYMSEEGAREAYVEHALLAPWLPTVHVDKGITFRGDLPHGESQVSYKATSEGYARLEEGELLVPLGGSKTLASELAPLVKRTLPVVLPPHLAPSHETRTIRILAPPGFRFDGLPQGGEEVLAPFGQARLEIRPEGTGGRAVQVVRHLSFDAHRISVEQYSDWRLWLQKVDRLMRKNLRLVRLGALPSLGRGAR